MMLIWTMQATTTNGSSCKVRAGPPAELPLHLTEKILCSISPLASARHATVCKSWASTISARLARPVPHLFASLSPDNTSDGRRGLLVSVPLHEDDGAAPPTTIPARVRSSDTNGLRCIGATPGTGRVAFAAGWWSQHVVLVNPVTGALERVHVGEPCRLDPRHSRVLASGDDSFFAVDGYELTLWRRLGGGEAWSRCAVTATSSPSNNIVSAVDCNGCFYLLRQDGCLSRVDSTAPPPLRMEKLPVESLITTHELGSFFSVKTDGRLLESDGEVLLVRQLLACKEQVEPCVSSLSVAGFEVLRLEVMEQRWAKVNKLPADRALFVSPGSSFAVHASEVERCRSNCIYFVGESQYHSSPACREDGHTQSSWGMYSLEERRVLFEHVVVTEPGRGAELFWFLPRLV